MKVGDAVNACHEALRVLALACHKQVGEAEMRRKRAESLRAEANAQLDAERSNRRRIEQELIDAHRRIAELERILSTVGT